MLILKPGTVSVTFHPGPLPASLLHNQACQLSSKLFFDPRFLLMPDCIRNELRLIYHSAILADKTSLLFG